MYVKGTNKVIFEENKNISKTQGKMSNLSPRISAKIMEFVPDEVVATLKCRLGLVGGKYLLFTIKHVCVPVQLCNSSNNRINAR